MNAREAWKDGEFGYCRQLVKTRGNGNVGRRPEAIASYLRLQAKDAQRTNAQDIAVRLNQAADLVENGDWPAAIERFADD